MGAAKTNATIGAGDPLQPIRRGIISAMDRRHPADRPHEKDQPAERTAAWWAEHAARERDITAPTRSRPDATPEQSRHDWYRDNRTPPDQQPAPFRREIADRVPAIQGRGARGRLDRHDGTSGIPIDSGRKTGLVDALSERLGYLPGSFTRQNESHVEAHAAAYLRLHPDIRDATLYLNRVPCKGPRGCKENLADMLPEGTTLTVYAPGGWADIYHGQPDPPRP
jgi:hypothetical protein